MIFRRTKRLKAVALAEAILVIVLLAGISRGWALSAQDAVVAIWATPPSGSPWVGTGFFVSKEGEVLTCYHVIRNAQKVMIYRGTQPYSDIEVVAISPQHDLAILRVNHLQQPPVFLRLSQERPGRFSTGELTVYGHVNGLMQKVPATVTAADYVPAAQIRSLDGGYRIFDLPEVKLITLQMIIYNGFSGGPVLAGEGVVGIISGSYNTSGAIAWAIPSIYASADQMSALHQPVGKVANWPNLDLIQDETRWNTLRQGLSLTTGLNLAINSYVESLDDVTTDIDRIVRAVHDEDQATESLLSQLKTVAEAKRNGTFTSRQQDELLLAQATFMTANAHFMLQTTPIEKDTEAVALRFNEMTSELLRFLGSLPSTPKNKKNSSIAIEKSVRLAKQISKTAKDYDRAYREFEKKLNRLNAKVGDGKSLTDEQRIVLLPQFKSLMDDFFLNKSQRAFGSMTSSFREIGEIAKAVIDLDVPAGPSATPQ